MCTFFLWSDKLLCEIKMCFRYLVDKKKKTNNNNNLYFFNIYLEVLENLKTQLFKLLIRLSHRIKFFLYYFHVIVIFKFLKILK